MKTASSQQRARTVRLDPSDREKLDSLAVSSDRTISQLVRYALSAYFALDPVPTPVLGLPDDREEPSTRHATLRLPEDLENAVAEHAVSHSVTYSDVVRHAVSLWLAEADNAQLGAPTKGGTP